MGKPAPSDSANRRFVSGSSALIMKYAMSMAFNASLDSRSDLHWAVQPPVNAMGNHASTTGVPA